MGTNYLKPFLSDVKTLVGQGVDAVTGKKKPDPGVELMGNPTDLQKKATEGSPAFSKAELKQGYRKVGKGK